MGKRLYEVYLWDSVDGHSYLFRDVYEAAKFLDYTSSTVRNSIAKGRPINKRYFAFDATKNGIDKLFQSKMNPICML